MSKMSKESHKATSDFKVTPLFPELELRVTRNSRGCYQKHTHAQFSIGIVDAGHSLCFNQGLQSPIQAGSLVFINPEEVHACNPMKETAWSYRMLYIDTPWFAALQEELLQPMQWDYWAFSTPVLHSPQAYLRMHKLFNTLLWETDEASKEQQFVVFLQDLLEQHGAPIREGEEAHQAVEQAKMLIHDRLSDKLSINDIASSVGLSEYYLIHRFKKQVGLTPHAYQLDQRITQARQMLKRGAEIAEVSQRLGFADQSHFHRHFKQRVVATPKQYQSSFA